MDCLPVSFESVSESLWSDKCDYWVMGKCHKLNPSNYNFIVIQWNIQSLISNMNELKLLLTKLEGKNTPTDAILLCETFLNKDTTKLIKIPDYTLHYINRTNQKGGGTAIMIKNGITHKRRKDLEIMVERKVEST